ncbi:hypothetical protein PX52LOC_06484 [Limnoglobus roseus]|uniref:Uncharacterized protein n=1 Tax=Limnoglobus roseus TaxID=2598579 RepID=A0A5C1AMS2_9BACT|nr:hypothetical protein PX52LOC_06484 [Limnoglobus roseus]
MNDLRKVDTRRPPLTLPAVRGEGKDVGRAVQGMRWFVGPPTALTTTGTGGKMNHAIRPIILELDSWEITSG